MRDFRKVLAIGLAALTFTAGCSKADSASEAGGDKSLKIDALYALSGPLGSFGKVYEQSAKAAVEVINAQGGVFGQPVELNVIDDGGSATQTASKAQELISKGGVQAVIPGMTSIETSASAPLFNRAGVFVSHHNLYMDLYDAKKYPYTFSNSYLPKDSSNVLADEFAKKGYKTVSMVISDAAGDITNAGAVKASLSAKGINTTIYRVPPDAVDATPQLSQAIAAHPDVLLLDSYGAAVPAIVKARAKLQPDMPTYGGQLFSANSLSKLAPASDYAGIEMLGAALQVKGTAPSETPAFKTFLAALNKQTGGRLDFGMSTYAAGYNDVILIAAAAELSKSTDAKRMAAAIEKATPDQIPNYVGPVTFSPTQHYPTLGPDQWVFIPYSPMVNGQYVPSGS